MYSVHDRIIVDNMSEFEHSSLAMLHLFDARFAESNAGSTTGHKTQQARLPADYGLYNSAFPSLVNCILTIPERRSDHRGRVHAQHRPDKASALPLHPRASVGS